MNNGLGFLHKFVFRVWRFFDKQCTNYASWQKRTRIKNKYFIQLRRYWFKLCSKVEFRLRRVVFPVEARLE